MLHSRKTLIRLMLTVALTTLSSPYCQAKKSPRYYTVRIVYYCVTTVSERVNYNKQTETNRVSYPFSQCVKVQEGKAHTFTIPPDNIPEQDKKTKWELSLKRISSDRVQVTLRDIQTKKSRRQTMKLGTACSYQMTNRTSRSHDFQGKDLWISDRSGIAIATAKPDTDTKRLYQSLEQALKAVILKQPELP